MDITKNMKKVAIAAATAATLALTGCTDADVASQNLSQDADNFKVMRRVTFVNGITDKYMLTIEGLCSIKDENNQLEVTCKTGEKQYKKHFLGLSDNVTYVAEQMTSTSSDASRYKVTFKPSVLIPDGEVR